MRCVEEAHVGMGHRYEVKNGEKGEKTMNLLVIMGHLTFCFVCI